MIKSKHLNSLIENGKPRTFKVLYNYDGIIILQPMKQQVSKPGKSGIKQKSLRQIVLEGFKRQEKFNKQIINRLDSVDNRLNNLVKKNNLIE